MNPFKIIPGWNGEMDWFSIIVGIAGAFIIAMVPWIMNRLAKRKDKMV